MPGTDIKEPSTKHKALSIKTQAKQRKWIACALLLVTAFSFRLCVALSLANDTPEDGRVYAQMARNLLEQHVYSHAPSPPYKPSLIRLPGYPIFLAAVYSIFGHWNNTAVRIVQSLLDTLSCALMAIVAWYWEPEEKRKRAASIAALSLAAVCPFTTIYVATVLTETWASLLAVTLALLATMALMSAQNPQPPDNPVTAKASLKRSLRWWGAAGLVAGASVFFRPDSGLFVAAVGLTLVISALIGQRTGSARLALRRRLAMAVAQGVVLTAAFVIVLVPWTVRNWREFHLFQPLSPTHGEMPGEYVQHGYFTWLRTWVDDRKYTEPMLWNMDESEVDVDELPATAFDSAEERERVRKLFDQYNDPPDEDDSKPTDQTPSTAPPTPTPAGLSGKTASAAARQTASPEEQADQEDKPEPEEQVQERPPEMTPALDVAFGQIARERIARAPLRYYVWLPLKRARSLWFGPHADYYPFAGELFPLEDLDHNTHQQIWLPLFEGLVWIYTLLGFAGGWRLWRSPEFASRRWLMLAALMIFLRLAFFSTKENPEPRYTVEIFPLLAILGGIAIARLVRLRQT